MKEAEKYHVLPIDDRTIDRTNPALAGRPDVLGDRTSSIRLVRESQHIFGLSPTASS